MFRITQIVVLCAGIAQATTICNGTLDVSTLANDAQSRYGISVYDPHEIQFVADGDGIGTMWLTSTDGAYSSPRIAMQNVISRHYDGTVLVGTSPALIGRYTWDPAVLPLFAANQAVLWLELDGGTGAAPRSAFIDARIGPALRFGGGADIQGWSTVGTAQSDVVANPEPSTALIVASGAALVWLYRTMVTRTGSLSRR